MYLPFFILCRSGPWPRLIQFAAMGRSYTFI